jgi:Ca2+-binding RTX toxin-like protein
MMATLSFISAIDMRYFANTGTQYHDAITGGLLDAATETSFDIEEQASGQDIFLGSGLGSPSGNMPNAGTITTWEHDLGLYSPSFGDWDYFVAWEITDFSLDASTVSSYVLSDDIDTLLSQFIMAGNDNVNGSNSADWLLGYTGNDTIDGAGGDDDLFGADGNDTLTGSAGYDRMYGGVGDDTYYVSDSTDFAYELAGEGHDTVSASVDARLRSNIEDLVLTGGAYIGKGNDLDNSITGTNYSNKLYGFNGADTLIARNGDDYLSGGDGDDLLRGGRGRDTMSGGAGNDTFKFTDGEFGGATRATADRITDFATGDKLNLSAVDASTQATGDQAFTFIGAGPFTHSAGELRYEQINGNTYISGDTNGDAIADFMIKLDGLHTVVVGDFSL